MPLLVSTLPAWEDLYVRMGFGRPCNPDSVESISAALEWFYDHPEDTRAMGERGRRKVLAEWNYEAQFKPVMEGLAEGGQS